MSEFTEYNGVYAFHPGYYVRETLESMETSQAEFATRMGTTAKTVSMLIAGKCRLSVEMAQKLSAMTGTSVDVWLNLQKAYDEKIFEIERQRELDAQKDIARLIDYSFFVKVAKLPEEKTVEGKIVNLCSYLHVADLRVLCEPDFLVNFRSGVKSFEQKNLINARAWVQTALNVAQGKPIKPFSAERLRDYLPEIRGMTLQKPAIFLPRLKYIFADCGVSFVLLPHLKNSGINGAVKWVTPERVVLAINDRRFYADTFWFSLFHEIRHVFQKKVKKVFVSLNASLGELDGELEADADSFAQNYLIPSVEYRAFINGPQISLQRIRAFAESISIHPGIVVGRLQHDGCIQRSHCNALKERYKIVLN